MQIAVLHKLVKETDVMWAVPNSSMGHVADEQPLPYIQQKGCELTPRFGGEENNDDTNIFSLPLPYGYLNTAWPIRQRLFNFPRRRINIYWKNIFRSFTNKNRCYHFLEQLRFCSLSHGFFGRSPTLNYQREFLVAGNKIIVKDKVSFKSDISFSELLICPWAQFPEPEINKKCLITPSVMPNYSRQINSSTGKATWYAHKMLNLTFTKGQFLEWSYKYIIK